MTFHRFAKIRRATAGALGIAFVAFAAQGAAAQDSVEIGLATKTWYPSVIAEAALRQGLFEKQGVDATLTVYQSGAEAFTAMAAGAADVVSTAPNAVASGRPRGVNSKIIGESGDNNFGWQLIVPTDSDLKTLEDLDGKTVGITSAGSLSDALAKWAKSKAGVEFNTIPLGGGGLVPNLLTGNVDAAVIYSPLSYQVIKDGDGVSIFDFGAQMPAHLNAGWAATDAMIADNPELIQKTVNALYEGLAYLQDNPEEGIALVAEINGIPEEIAKEEYENVIKMASRDGVMTLEGAETALEFARAAGFSDLAPAADIFTDAFTPAPKN
ncbi:ABC transporter substrate-binding protein [Acuticoccus sp. M5D2P5]|uniref:ABC transporter substrate-binding protein n=1 Tax=Acuticoccus kalidii TaxID=2910977 RepID=UPI001F3D33B7|nr:ABC transporter substrate-binding protein [Acuticoccus kalidii]MCF3933170.1 ABC transporter substrate-binding protein [Acuticoccus kalidii]